jgi:hypothetical protein
LRLSAKQASELAAAGSLANKIWHALCRYAVVPAMAKTLFAWLRDAQTLQSVTWEWRRRILLTIDWQVVQLKTVLSGQQS